MHANVHFEGQKHTCIFRRDAIKRVYFTRVVAGLLNFSVSLARGAFSLFMHAPGKLTRFLDHLENRPSYAEKLSQLENYGTCHGLV